MLVMLLAAWALTAEAAKVPKWVNEERAAAEASFDQGDVHGAEAAYEALRVEAEAKLGPDHVGVGPALEGLASCRITLGDPGAALPLLERAIKLYETAYGEDDLRLSPVLMTYGATLYQVGDYGAALPALRRAYSVLPEKENYYVGIRAGILGNLGLVLLARGEVDAAVDTLNQAAALDEQVLSADDPALARAYGNVGYAYSMVGSYPEAKAALDKALPIFEHAYGPDHPETLQTRYNLATAAQGMGDLDGALAAYRELLDARIRVVGAGTPDEAAMRGSIAGLLEQKGLTDDAIAEYGRAIEILEKTVGLRHLYASRIVPYDAILLLATGQEDAARDLTTRWRAAIETNVDAVLGIASEDERVQMIRSARPALDVWLSIHDRPEDAKEAWTASLRWKQVSLRALTSQRETLLAARDPQAAALFTELAHTREELAKLAFDPNTTEDQVNALWLRSYQLDLELGARSQMWARENPRATPEAICAALPKDSVLVDYIGYPRWKVVDGEWVPGEALYAAFVVTPACKVQRVDLPLVPVQERLETWWNRLWEGKPLAVTDAGVSLREAAWDPVAPLVGQAKRVIVAGDGYTSVVAWGGLPLAGERYLVEDHTFVQVEHAEDVLRWGLPDAPAKGAVVIGGIDYGLATPPVVSERRAACLPEEFVPLPGTAQEARAVAQTLTSHHEDAEVLSGTDASEANVVAAMPGKQVIHLATHGFYSPRCAAEGTYAEALRSENPMLRSGVALAGAANGGQDGILTAEEVSGLDLRGTEIVVLSACQTALGDFVHGEGVMGMRRAFTLASVDTLVVALWSVPDEPTRDLMIGLYQRLDGKMGAADALRGSQLELLKRYRADHGRGDPVAWAAFIVVGDPGF